MKQIRKMTLTERNPEMLSIPGLVFSLLFPWETVALFGVTSNSHAEEKGEGVIEDEGERGTNRNKDDEMSRLVRVKKKAKSRLVKKVTKKVLKHESA